MNKATMLAMSAAAIMSGVSLGDLSPGGGGTTAERGYKLGEGFNLTREKARRVRQMRRDAANQAMRKLRNRST
jgi:hypothetical protein